MSVWEDVVLERVSLSCAAGVCLCTVQRAVIHESSSEEAVEEGAGPSALSAKVENSDGACVLVFRAVPRGAPPCACVLCT